MCATHTHELAATFTEFNTVEATHEALLSEVRRGLLSRPRSLAPWMFYDAEGSRLFEEITMLPEYYLTRTELGIFRRHASDMAAAARTNASQSLRVVELGAGSASKTGVLLDAIVRAQGQVSYLPIDVSSVSLMKASESLAEKLPGVRTEPVVANYVTDSVRIRPFDGTTLALYIGSSIGNFSPAEARGILRNLRTQLKSGDALLLGTDLVKAPRRLIAAYDDSRGVTAKFNLNILERLNRELDANFELSQFQHRAFWNAAESRIEMHLESLKEQLIRIPETGFHIRLLKGETIHTENSYKFKTQSIAELIEDAGFSVERTWMDERCWYAVTLCRVS
jgi:L-histidine N-alpha-methyltransferase